MTRQDAILEPSDPLSGYKYSIKLRAKCSPARVRSEKISPAAGCTALLVGSPDRPRSHMLNTLGLGIASHAKVRES